MVELKEVMASRQKVYMVMELVPGGELFDKVVAEGPMSVRLPFSTLSLVLLRFASLHSAQILQAIRH